MNFSERKIPEGDDDEIEAFCRNFLPPVPGPGMEWVYRGWGYRTKHKTHLAFSSGTYADFSYAEEMAEGFTSLIYFEAIDSSPVMEIENYDPF